ncbi:MAG TPA: signal peptidase I [Acidimicrobiales bacterium]|nr:signal peptidase I [Acidimicrobiales bacterium]
MSGGLRSSLEWGAVIVGALAIALLIQAFLFQAYLIPSGSMQPTLDIGDRVLVNKLSYRSSEPSRGDIIVFKRPPGQPESEIKDLIKRVVGLPGETLEAVDGQVLVDGEPIDESYLPDRTQTTNLPQTTVPDHTVFVMGDNRTESFDSRFFGPIDTDLIEGRAILRIWPLGDFGGL